MPTNPCLTGACPATTKEKDGTHSAIRDDRNRTRLHVWLMHHASELPFSHPEKDRKLSAQCDLSQEES
eukprot:scaffold2048_cov288-Ochromonas_danica.AAC.1